MCSKFILFILSFKQLAGDMFYSSFKYKRGYTILQFEKKCVFSFSAVFHVMTHKEKHQVNIIIIKWELSLPWPYGLSIDNIILCACQHVKPM